MDRAEAAFEAWLHGALYELVEAEHLGSVDAEDHIRDLRQCWQASRAAAVAELRRYRTLIAEWLEALENGRQESNHALDEAASWVVEGMEQALEQKEPPK